MTTPVQRSECGFSLVELIIALTVLSVGILALAGTLGSSMRLGNDRTSEIQRAIHVQNVRNTIAAIPFDEIGATFGPGSGNEEFWCTGLGQVLFNDPGDAVTSGSIEVFTDESSVPETFGAPNEQLDLNANGTIDAAPVTDYRILPVRISLGTSGDPASPIEVEEFLLRP